VKRLLPLASALLVVLPQGDLSAEPIDAAFPSVVKVGRAKSPAPSERLDPARRSRSNVLLPAQPTELWRKSMGALAHAPVVLPDGGLVVALSSPEIARLAADGTEISRVRIGAAPALRAPVVLPSGGVAVLTGAPSVVFLSPSGKLAATVALPRGSFAVQSAGGLPDGFASIVATDDGAVIVAAGRSLLSVDASGRVAARATLPERVVSDPLEQGGGLLVVGESGGVYRVAVPAEPMKIGVLVGAAIGTAALVDERTLIALAQPNRIVSLDLKSGVAVTRVGDSAFAMFDTPPAVAADGTAWLTTVEGFLVGYDASGAELSRVQLDRNASPPGGLLSVRPPGLAGVGMPFPARLGTVVDRAGAVAFSRPQGRIGVRDTAGKIVVAVERGCTTPLSITPTAPRKMLAACREGTLIMLGDAPNDAPAAEPEPPKAPDAAGTPKKSE
jgi:outer membrane protein assembly factor BamB